LVVLIILTICDNEIMYVIIICVSINSVLLDVLKLFYSTLYLFEPV